MLSLAQSLFLDSELRVEQELPHVGSVRGRWHSHNQPPGNQPNEDKDLGRVNHNGPPVSERGLVVCTLRTPRHRNVTNLPGERPC